MEILRNIARSLGVGSPKELPAIVLEKGGFSVFDHSVHWSDISEIEACKHDRLTTDEVIFTVTLTSGTVLDISEEQPGFPGFIAALKANIPAVNDWELKVIPNAFHANRSVLYRRL